LYLNKDGRRRRRRRRRRGGAVYHLAPALFFNHWVIIGKAQPWHSLQCDG